MIKDRLKICSRVVITIVLLVVLIILSIVLVISIGTNKRYVKEDGIASNTKLHYRWGYRISSASITGLYKASDEGAESVVNDNKQVDIYHITGTVNYVLNKDDITIDISSENIAQDVDFNRLGTNIILKISESGKVHIQNDGVN